jgi:ACR3 family arsenite efflux pump ArsB
LVNFIVVPALTIAAATGFGLKRDIAVAMVLLAASPFAPVVPVFARMARADLALAAGLTAMFPLVTLLLASIFLHERINFVHPRNEILLDGNRAAKWSAADSEQD